MSRREVRLRIGTFTALLVAVGLMGMAANSVLFERDTGSSDATSVPSTSGRSGVGPLGAVAGFPTGFARSRAGATAAAASWVAHAGGLYAMDSPSRGRALHAISAAASTDSVVAQASRGFADLDALAQHGQGPASWAVWPLAIRVDGYTPSRARVRVWRVGIVSVAGLVAPLSSWATVTDELVWEHGDWKLWSETVAPGPAPSPRPDVAASTPAQFSDALSGFTTMLGGVG